MKKLLLLLSFLVVTAAFTAQAEMVSATIKVDNAANVLVAYQSAYGEEIQLTSGSNPVTLDDTQQPLYIGAKNDATITEVKLGGIAQMSLRNNECRLAISEGMEVEITTSAPSSDASVSFSLDNAGAVTITADGTELTDLSSQTLPIGTEITITPGIGYTISNVSCQNGHATDNNDGSWTVKIGQDDTIYISTTVTGISFTVSIDNIDNVSVTLGQGLNEYTPAGLHNGENTVVSTAEYMPINFLPANDATIVSITKNGQNVNSSGDGGYHSAFDSDDEFVVTTKSAISGTTVVINADNASRIIIKQANGYGDALSLTNGENKFEVGDIDNPLKISASEGNELLSVKHNGLDINPANDGSYIIKAEGGSAIDITSRVIPVAVPVTLAIAPENGYGNIILTVDNEPQTLTQASSVIQIKTGSVISLAPKAGYTISSFTCNGSNHQESDGIYTVTIENPTSISLAVSEMQAHDGYAIVTFDVSGPSIHISEYDGENFVGSLDSSKAHEIKIGNSVNIYTFTKTIFFNQVSVNGVPVQPDADNEKSYTITIAETTQIKIDTYNKAEIVTYDTYNTENHSTIGRIYIYDGDEKVTSYYATAGETVKFVAEPAAGYVLDYIKRVYPESDYKYEDSYTVLQSDIDNEFVIFEGVFIEDEENPSYVIRGETTYIHNDDEAPIKAGTVYVIENGVERMETIANEGSEVKLSAIPETGYKFVRFTLFIDNDVTIDNPYIVDGKHADELKVINICAEFIPQTGGVDEICRADTELAYDADAQALTSSSETAIYDINGHLLLKAEAGRTNLSALKAGTYIAVSGNKILKFIR